MFAQVVCADGGRAAAGRERGGHGGVDAWRGPTPPGCTCRTASWLSTCTDEWLKNAKGCFSAAAGQHRRRLCSASRVCTAAPHCSADNRQSRRGSAGSGVQAAVDPPVPVVEPPVPVLNRRCRCSSRRCRSSSHRCRCSSRRYRCSSRRCRCSSRRCRCSSRRCPSSSPLAGGRRAGHAISDCPLATAAPNRAAAVRRPKRGRVLIAPPISRASVSHFEIGSAREFLKIVTFLRIAANCQTKPQQLDLSFTPSSGECFFQMRPGLRLITVRGSTRCAPRAGREMKLVAD